MSSTDIQLYDDAQRLALLSEYRPAEHLLQWTAYDKRSNRSQVVTYYPAAWRLYELSLRYPTANFESNIHFMDIERDFVIVKVKLYLGNDYGMSHKKAEAFKQGKLSELDRVETKAKARAARDFGIGTEHALDLDDTPDNEVAGTSTVIEAQPEPTTAPRALPAAAPAMSPQKKALVDLFNKTKALAQELGIEWEEEKALVLGRPVADKELTAATLGQINADLSKARISKAS